MNEFDRARVERARRPVIADGNRVRTEGPSRWPSQCHDYGPREPQHTPERRAAILGAIEKMEEISRVDKTICVETLA